jgi:hypothetical protein
MKCLCFSVAAILAVAATGSAHAGELFSGLKSSDCADGVVVNSALRDKVLADAKVPLTVPVATGLVEGRLGTLARKAERDCLGKICEGADLALANLHHSLLELAAATPMVPDGFAISVDGVSAPLRVDRAENFLNGRWDWVKVRCTVAPTMQTVQTKKPDPRPSNATKPELVIAKTEDDAGKDFGKRAFASIGLSSDREANETTWDIDAFVGFSSPLLGLGSELELQPFASFQYHTGKEVDDLSVGGAVMWYPGNSGHLVRLKGAWETDHRFKSSLWRADLGWTPPLLDACERSSVPGKHYANCELTFVADYANIAAAGDKADLLKLKNFARVGMDTRFTYGHSVGEDFGFVIASAGFSFRRDPSGSKGDAELFTASLGLTPSDQGKWKISLDYTKGRDLTELTKQDKILITLGFRH